MMMWIRWAEDRFGGRRVFLWFCGMGILHLQRSRADLGNDTLVSNFFFSGVSLQFLLRLDYASWFIVGLLYI